MRPPRRTTRRWAVLVAVLALFIPGGCLFYTSSDVLPVGGHDFPALDEDAPVDVLVDAAAPASFQAEFPDLPRVGAASIRDAVYVAIGTAHVDHHSVVAGSWERSMRPGQLKTYASNVARRRGGDVVLLRGPRLFEILRRVPPQPDPRR